MSNPEYLSSLVKNNLKLCHENKDAFRRIFSKNLKQYMHSVTGFDIIAFSDDFVDIQENQSLSEYLGAKHGEEGKELILKLIEWRGK